MRYMDCTIGFRVKRDGFSDTITIRADLRDDADLVSQSHDEIAEWIAREERAFGHVYYLPDLAYIYYWDDEAQQYIVIE